MQASGEQFVSVEDSMSMVHTSRGRLLPPAPTVRSEVAIVTGLGEALFGGGDDDLGCSTPSPRRATLPHPSPSVRLERSA